VHEIPLLAVAELVFVIAAFTLTTAVAWRVSRGGGSAAVTVLSEANKVLENKMHEQQRKIDELGAEVRDLRVENAELRSRTDYQAVINEHEKRANERHGATLKVLELIAARLGPDPVPV
jgi:cell division protein FtsB